MDAVKHTCIHSYIQISEVQYSITQYNTVQQNKTIQFKRAQRITPKLMLLITTQYNSKQRKFNTIKHSI